MAMTARASCDAQDPAPILERPGLYVVATPLGNLADITLRALDTLRGVDAVAAEDTRHSGRLLAHFGVRKPMIALHEHNERKATGRVLEHLRSGGAVALVTDAGTPAVSDPGAGCVAAVRAAGFRVIPVPGPSALTAALSVAGEAGPHFLFYGFLPPKPAARRKALAGLEALPFPVVFYEAPHRIRETLADLAGVLGDDRSVLVCRELTKQFESIDRVALGEAVDWLGQDPNRERGEFVLIVSGATRRQEDRPGEAQRVLSLLLDALPTRAAVDLACAITGEPRKPLYEAALRAKGRSV